jgi:head-tail adaptor
MPAGKLRDRLTFQAYVGVEDDFGNTAGSWQHKFTTAASIAFLRGGESVMASRLAAKQPAILTIRNSEQAREIEPEWRAVNARTDEIFNIREKPRESKDNRGYLEVLVEIGVVA